MHRAVACGCLAISIGAGTPLQAQRAWEWQVQGLATVVPGYEVGDAGRFRGAGGGLAFRNDGRLRASASLSGGDLEGALGLRVEVALSFHLNPYKRAGLTLYGGGGIAAAVARQGIREYALVLVGVETNPGGMRGWFVESGVGGGIRLAAGLRLRWGRAR